MMTDLSLIISHEQSQSQAEEEHIVASGIEVKLWMGERDGRGREWIVDSNLTAIYQSSHCVACAENVSPIVYAATLINIHPRNSFLLI